MLLDEVGVTIVTSDQQTAQCLLSLHTLELNYMWSINVKDKLNPKLLLFLLTHNHIVSCWHVMLIRAFLKLHSNFKNVSNSVTNYLLKNVVSNLIQASQY